MTADLAALLESDPAAGILAVAELREQRAKAATPGPYVARSCDDGVEIAAGPPAAVWLYIGDEAQDHHDAEHIAAEANPAHALTETALWRVIVEEHSHPRYPCSHLAAVRDAARAYLGGAS